MVSVDARVDRVETELRAGLLSCPGCAGVLRPWGFARLRVLRAGAVRVGLRPRRGRCAGCRATHVLLPVMALLRRVDVVEVIGSALELKAFGAGHRSIAARMGVPATTARGWLRRFASRAEEIRVFFARLALLLDASFSRFTPHQARFADAVESIGHAASSAAAAFGRRPVWQFAAGATGGMLLANTNAPFPQ